MIHSLSETNNKSAVSPPDQQNELIIGWEGEWDAEWLAVRSVKLRRRQLPPAGKNVSWYCKCVSEEAGVNYESWLWTVRIEIKLNNIVSV